MNKSLLCQIHILIFLILLPYHNQRPSKMQTPSKDHFYSHNKNDHYMVSDSSGLKCICEMCSCGKHQCPRKIPKTDFETSYSRYYQKPRQILPVEQRPPYRYEQRHYSPDVLKTNYQQNFQSQPELQPQSGPSHSRLELVGVKFCLQKKTIMSPQIPFMGVSSYKDQYQPYNLIKRREFDNPEMEILQTMKSHQYRKPVAKFEGISSYKSEFLSPPEPKKVEPKPAYQISKAPFYGTTSYNEQYKPVQIVPFEYKVESSPYKNFKTVKFQGKSAYKEQFVPYEQLASPYDSRMSHTKSGCKLDQVVVPKVNFINDRDHVLYDPESKRFY